MTEKKTATVTSIGKYGIAAKRKFGPPMADGCYDIHLHEGDNPGIVQRHKVGDVIQVECGPKGEGACLDWREVIA